MTSHKFFTSLIEQHRVGYRYTVILQFPTGSARCTGMTKYEVCVEAFENIMSEEPFQADDVRITAFPYERRVVLELFKNKRRYWIEINESAVHFDRLKALNIASASASLRLAAKRDTDTIAAVTKRLTQGLK